VKYENMSLHGASLNIQRWNWSCRVQEVFLVVRVYN